MPWIAQRNGRGSQGQLPTKTSKQVIFEPHSDGWAFQMKMGSRVPRQRIWEWVRVAELVGSGDLFWGLLNRRQMQLGLHFENTYRPVWGRLKNERRKTKSEEVVVMLVPAWVVGMGIRCGGRRGSACRGSLASCLSQLCFCSSVSSLARMATFVALVVTFLLR